MKHPISHYDHVSLLQDTFPFTILVNHFARFDIDHLQMIRTEQGNLALPVQDKESDIHGKRGIEGPDV